MMLSMACNLHVACLDGFLPGGNNIAFNVLDVDNLFYADFRNGNLAFLLTLLAFVALGLCLGAVFLAAAFGLSAALAFGLVAFAALVAVFFTGLALLFAGLVAFCFTLASRLCFASGFGLALRPAFGAFGLGFTLGLLTLAAGFQEHENASFLASLHGCNFLSLNLKGLGADAVGADRSFVLDGESHHILFGTGNDGGHFILALTARNGGQDTKTQGADHRNLFHIHKNYKLSACLYRPQ